MKFLCRHPKLSTTVLSSITLLTGAAAVILADFGAPLWVFAALLLWPATLGIPSTLAVLLVAMFWGRTSWASGLVGFVGVSALLAWLLQWAAVTVWNRWRHRKSFVP